MCNSWSFVALLLILLEPNVNAKVGVVNLATPWLTVDEDKGPVNVVLIREGGSDGPLTVKYEIQPITALPDVDFRSTSGLPSVTFRSGQTLARIEVSITDDNVEEPTEMLFLLLSGRNTGHSTFLTIEIKDDDMYSQWSEWSGLCSTICGKGVANQTRKRTCESHIKSRCELVEESRRKECSFGSCVLSSRKCWSRWGSWIRDGFCNLFCEQKWTRSRRCLCATCLGKSVDIRKTSCVRAWCILSLHVHEEVSADVLASEMAYLDSEIYDF